MQNGKHLTKYLSPINVWALSFGCAVGWGAFVMPGTTFLPLAGPLGTAIGIAISAVVMLAIGLNYHYLMNKYPDAGGTMTYAIKTFGYDHGFLCAWFLVLVYVAIIWANATALALIGRNLLGTRFQFGFHYNVLGYDVYFGEALLSIAALLICGFLCSRGKRLAVWVQTLLALVLFFGVVLCAAAVLHRRGGGLATIAPAFSLGGKPKLGQVFGIVALSLWAFVGFESVSQSVEGFRFSVRKSIWIMAAALFTGALSYILLAEMAAALPPEGYESWPSYIASLDRLDGLKGLPTFYSTYEAMGRTGLVCLGVTVSAAIVTGLVGHFIAASRLLYMMSEDGILPRWFGELNRDGSPKNALLFLAVGSIFIPFLGRTAVGWIVDVTTIGATIAYAYTSSAALTCARRDGDRPALVTGVTGLAAALLFFLYFMSWNVGAMPTESYLILAVWSILGFVFFHVVFHADTRRRFGKSTIVWIGLLFLIFFTTLMWVRKGTNEITQRVLAELDEYNVSELAEHGILLDREEQLDAERYLEWQMSRVNSALTRYSLIQMGLIVASLGIMFSLYTTMSRREKQMEVEKAKAEESSKAKSTFLSNMSHDIRTPMNAIIGYTELARREDNDLRQTREYLEKIDASGKHLLALINDVLEMSRIESGKMDIELAETDLCRTLAGAHDMFASQMSEKGIDFTVDTSRVKNARVLCDRNRLNRVLLNLLSNAYKFTPRGGSIALTLEERETGAEHADYELRVKDNGIGMAPEFAAHVFEAFERERTSTVSGIQGTGLGMAITKSIVDLMGGTINVVTAPDEGTEFVIRLRFALARGGGGSEEGEAEEQAPDFSAMRLLLVDDNEINREIAVLLLEEAGFTVDTAENGRQAVDAVTAAPAGTYNAVLMDIQMPEMNGYEATRAIRALPDAAKAGIPVVAMTANAFSEDVRSAKDAGMDAHIAKPIDVPKMLSTLGWVLRGK